MRLSRLNAHFIGQWHAKSYRHLGTIDGAQGLLFQCPKCAVGCEYGEEPDPITGGIRGFHRGAHHILCWFRNPRNAEPVPDDADPKPGRWWVAGETIEDISFVAGDPPMANSVLLIGGCDWHGFVKDGDAA